MRDLLPVELSRAAAIAEECDCCPVPCCNYCRVQVTWTAVASAERTSGSTVETVDWNVSLGMIFNRDDDAGAPTFPPTFRVVEALDEEDCQLLSNGGPHAHLTPGSYTYVRTVGGVEVDREEVDLDPWLNQFQLYLDCENVQQDDPASLVRFFLDSDLPGAPSTMPAEWTSYFTSVTKTFDNIGTTTPGLGVSTTIAINELSGWDTSSRTCSASVQITRCEDL